MGNSLGVTTGPKQIIKSTKSKFATPKVGELAKSWIWVLSPSKKHQHEPENKKPKKQETKKKQKNKTQKSKKTRLHTPRGGVVVAESWVLSFFFPVVWFLVFLVSCFILVFGVVSHCRKNQQRTRKKETKKTRNQQNKKQNKDCTPQGGSSGRELGLVIFFVFPQIAGKL